MIKLRSKQSAFTIVELLVVIVVIGILAAITIVSYSGIQQRANEASVKSNLRNVQTKLALWYVENGDSYPPSINDLNLPAQANTNYDYHQTSGGYCVAVTNTLNGLVYHMSSSTPGEMIAGGCYKTWKQITATYHHTCGITVDDMAYCWGNNSYGQLGDNSTTSSLVPIPVYASGELSGKTVKSITANIYHTCVIASDDNAYCWGRNNQGQIGDNTMSQRTVPTAVNKTGALSGLTIKSISAGSYYTCAIASDNNGYCWGDNSYGILGDNTTDQKSVPTAVYKTGALNGLYLKSISAGKSYLTCAIASDNNAYCWGNNNYGQLGDDTTAQKSVPTAVYRTGALNGLTIKSISAGYDYTCAIASDDNMYCWGSNGNGQLGDNTVVQKQVPTAVYKTGALNGLMIKAIAADDCHTCAVASDNKGYCWGGNDFGQIGDNTIIEKHVPTAVYMSGVLNGLTINSITVGNHYHTCSIASNGYVYCWGNNNFGQIGDNSTTQRNVPTATQLVPY